MKSDIQGCSTCPIGGEQYEEFDSGRGRRVQYDYRTEAGKLFSTIAPDLETARRRRDAWLALQRPDHIHNEMIAMRSSDDGQFLGWKCICGYIFQNKSPSAK